MRLYTVLLTVFAIIIATVQADYCCDKTFFHDGSKIDSLLTYKEAWLVCKEGITK